MKLLIVKLGSIGDIIHALPALAAVGRALPHAEISWVVDVRTAEILRGNRMIDRLIEVDLGALRGGRIVEEILLDVSKQVRDLRKFKFDIAIDLQGLWKSAAIAKLSGARRRIGFSRQSLREPASRILLTGTVEVPEPAHVIRQNIALVAGALGINLDNEDIEFPIASDESDRQEALEIVRQAGGDLAILNPGGGWVTKLWPAANFGKLADRLWNEKGLVPVIVTGPGEDALADEAAAASDSGKLIRVSPGLKAFYELARQARLYIGGDTGPTHIAIAAGTPVVGLFGPTEWWRNGSINPLDICVERTDIDCRVDCHRRTCSKWICMDIDVETVFDASTRRLASAG